MRQVQRHIRYTIRFGIIFKLVRLIAVELSELSLHERTHQKVWLQLYMVNRGSKTRYLVEVP